MKLKSHLIISTIFFTITLQLNGCATSNKHYAELGAADVPHIAMIRPSRSDNGKVLYNTTICAKIPKACGFFRSHAHAHAVLLHPILPPESYPEGTERAADCWAGKFGEPDEVVAAVQLLSDKDQYEGLPIVGDPEARAIHIMSCAEEAGNWPADA